MTPSARRDDFTADTAATNMSGESLLSSVLLRIDNKFDRVLILAHWALGISVTSLARSLDLDRGELSAHIAAIRVKLRADKKLKAELQDIGRAGQFDHYQAIVAQLNLEDWFCSY